MSASAQEAQDAPDTGSVRTWMETKPVWLVGVVAVLAAAIVTELFALLGRAFDVTMEAAPIGSDEAESIPGGAFAFSTALWGTVGIILAIALARWARRPARTFVVVTLIGTVLSLGSPMLAEDTETGTRVFLSVSHFVAAAVIIPPLALRLVRVEADRGEAPDDDAGEGDDGAAVDDGESSSKAEAEPEPGSTTEADTAGQEESEQTTAEEESAEPEPEETKQAEPKAKQKKAKAKPAAADKGDAEPATEGD